MFLFPSYFSSLPFLGTSLSCHGINLSLLQYMTDFLISRIELTILHHVGSRHISCHGHVSCFLRQHQKLPWNHSYLSRCGPSAFPPFFADEPVASGESAHLSPAQALHFSLSYMISAPAPRQLSSHKLSQPLVTYSRPNAFKDGNQILRRLSPNASLYVNMFFGICRVFLIRISFPSLKTVEKRSSRETSR